MGRSFKQRKLKKTRRVKVRSATIPSKSTAVKEKKKIKTWEYFLWGGAVIAAIIFIIFAARTGNVTPDIAPTPTVVETSKTE
ncbi:MAG TPA: hypothetical protein PLV45_08150 [bacterium]|nr:hypothetical protein [bacterium]